MGELRKIDEMLRRAEARMDAMGTTFVDRLFTGSPPTPDFSELKEDWELGTFAQAYNMLFDPKLVWARRNPPGTNHADFSVYTADKSYLLDIEVTALFAKPPVKKPSRYEDFQPYPVYPDVSDPAAYHEDIDEPRKVKPYANLERVVEAHLRDKYPAYWLVIYDNEIWADRTQLEDLIRQILQKRANRGRLPTNLKQVWAFDSHRLLNVLP